MNWQNYLPRSDVVKNQLCLLSVPSCLFSFRDAKHASSAHKLPLGCEWLEVRLKLPKFTAVSCTLFVASVAFEDEIEAQFVGVVLNCPVLRRLGETFQRENC